MARVLATGDLDGDGTQDFPAIRSVRVGTVSTDMGADSAGTPTCPDGYGDDGILRTAGHGTGCEATYPSYAELSADDPSADVDAFVQQVSCVAVLGTGGCGFEQPLEAALKALTPSTSSLRFANGTTGHGNAENAGFLRDGSVLATLVVSDENDCSASDRTITDPTSTTFTGPLNLRCMQYPDALYPPSRYIDGLQALRANPDDVIFASISGVPVDLVSEPTDYSAVLSDPRMTETIDPTRPETLEPSCNEPNGGIATPPTRTVQVAQGFGGNGVVQSILPVGLHPRHRRRAHPRGRPRQRQLHRALSDVHDGLRCHPAGRTRSGCVASPTTDPEPESTSSPTAKRSVRMPSPKSAASAPNLADSDVVGTTRGTDSSSEDPEHATHDNRGPSREARRHGSRCATNTNSSGRRKMQGEASRTFANACAARVRGDGGRGAHDSVPRPGPSDAAQDLTADGVARPERAEHTEGAGRQVVLVVVERDQRAGRRRVAVLAEDQGGLAGLRVATEQAPRDGRAHLRVGLVQPEARDLVHREPVGARGARRAAQARAARCP